MFVKNTFANGEWMDEERIRYFPFSPGEKFRMTIKMEANNFDLFVNETLIGEYRYRDASVNEIDTVYIQGDVVIYKVFLFNRVRKHAKYSFFDKINLLT